jgi:glycerol-1-phosphate dehydrogenase [NAD(P)+]
LLQQALLDATDTRQVVIGEGALASIVEVFQQSFDLRSAAIIADENTFDSAGHEVQRQLSKAHLHLIEPFIFPGQPLLHADYEHVLELESSLRQHDAIPVVVGSGTLNDLTKVAAHRCERPYLIVATAASMDGYTAFGAAITRDGFKQTMACPAPRAVVADVDVLINAPAEMTAWGYADLLGKITAGCPTTPEEIGLDRARLKASYAQARQIRSRYTVFDLAAEANCLPKCVENLFAPGGFWFEA